MLGASKVKVVHPFDAWFAAAANNAPTHNCFPP